MKLLLLGKMFFLSVCISFFIDIKRRFSSFLKKGNSIQVLFYKFISNIKCGRHNSISNHIPIVFNRYTFILLLSLGGLSSYAQDLILDTQAGIPVRSSNTDSPFLKKLATQRTTTKIQKPFEFLQHKVEAKGEVFLALDEKIYQELLAKKSDYLELAIPVDDANEIELELYQIDILSPDFKVITSSGGEYEIGSKSVFYHGMVKNHPASWVAVSIFEDKLTIFINDARGKYTLGKVENASNYVLYNEVNKVTDYGFNCGTADLMDAAQLPKVTPQKSTSRNLVDCPVYVYLEVDNESYGLYNDVNAVTTYVTSFFNQIIALYTANGITLKLSGLKVWDTNDPYGDASDPTVTDLSGILLRSFGLNLQNDYPGRLAHLLTIYPENSGDYGGGANTGVLCDSYHVAEFGPSGPYAVSAIHTTFENYPTFSRGLKVVAHELGHNFGSRHTHACVWGPNNDTAIDNCASLQDGPCSVMNDVSVLTNYVGTIMSYCPDNSTSLNFHSDVQALIQANYQAALTSCINESYCTLYADADDDGFGSSTVWNYGDGGKAVFNSLDGNDNNAAVTPLVIENCGNNIDDNGNGIIDENTLALNFGDNDDAVSFGNTLGNFGTSNFSIEAKIKTTHKGIILSKRPVCDNANYWAVSIDANGKIALERNNGTSASNVISSNTFDIADGTWHHFAITSTGGAVAFYIDGVPSGAYGAIAYDFTNTTDLSIGNNPCGNSNNGNFMGQIDELRIWDTALSGAFIGATKDAFLPGNYAGLIAYYDFNNNTATGGQDNAGQTTVMDRTGNNNGTLTNFALTGNTSNWVENPACATVSDCTDNTKKITTLYGIGTSGYTGDGAAARLAQFSAITDLVYDANGNLFILDAGNHVIRKVDATTGNVSTIAGTGVSGYGGDGGQATAAQFNFPRAITFDSNGDLFISDANNNRIRKIDMTTGIITTVVGDGSAGDCCQNGPATTAQINFPMGVVFSNTGQMFFVDSNNGALKTVDGSGNIQVISYDFFLPQQLAIDANDNLYIIDFLNRQIKKLDAANNFAISVIAGTGGFGYAGDGGLATAAQLNLGQGCKIIFDTDNHLYFADAGSHAIRRIDANTGIITTVAGTGTTGYSGDNGLATLANLSNPSSIAFNASGELLIADSGNNAIRTVTCETSCTVAISDITITYGDCLVNGNSQAVVTATCSGCANGISDIEYAVDGINFQSGNIFTNLKDSTYTITVREKLAVTCKSAEKITLNQDYDITPPTIICQDITVNLDASGTATITASQVDNGSSDDCSATGNLTLSLSKSSFNCDDLSGNTGESCIESSIIAGMPAISGSANGTGSSAASFNFPRAIITDAAGNIFVADERNHLIRKITPAGVVTTFAGMVGVSGSQDGTGASASFFNPTGITIDQSGNLYVSDSRNYTIRKITPAGAVTTLAGMVGVRGAADGTGGAASFSTLRGLATDSQGNIYAADYNNIIRKITPAGVVTTIAGTAGVTGSADGNGASAEFNLPIDVAVDGSDNIYVVEFSNSTIRKITPNGDVTTVAGMAGVQGAANGTGINASFSAPSGLEVAADGTIYVAEQSNNAVRKITPTGEVTTLAGHSGVRGHQTGDNNNTTLYAPYGITLDPNGNILVTELSGHTIRKIEVLPNCTATTLTVTDENGNSASCIAQVQLTDSNNACQPAMATALDFDGTDDFVDLGVWNPFSSTGFTQEAWVYADNIGPDNWSNSILIQEGGGGTSTILRAGAGNNVRASYHYAGGIYDLDGTITTNQWHHVAMVWDGSTFALYIDGALAQSIPATNPPSQTSSNLYIGNSQVENRIWDGKIDEVRIWGRGLCQGEIQSRMHCELVGDEADLLAYYSFNQGMTLSDNAFVSTLIDSSANNNHGTLTNFALDGSASNWTDGTDNGVSGDCGVASCCDLDITTPPTNQTICDGEEVTFSVAATSSAGGLTYDWQKIGQSNAWVTHDETSSPAGIPSRFVNGVTVYNNVMYACTPFGLAYLDLTNPTAWSVYSTTSGPSGLPSDNVRNIFIKDGIIYAGTNVGLATLDLANNATSWTVYSTTEGPANFPASTGPSEIQVENGVIYIGSGGGAASLDVANNATEWTLYRTNVGPANLPSNDVRSIFYKEDVLYVGTFFGGAASLDLTNPSATWTVYDTDVNNPISNYPHMTTRDIFVDNGVIFAATHGGLATLDIANNATEWTVYSTTTGPNGLTSNTITDVTVVDGTIYVAAQSGGLGVLEEGATSWYVHTGNSPNPPGFPLNAFVNKVYVEDGNIVVGTTKGLAAFLKSTISIGITTSDYTFTPQNGDEICTYRVIITDANNCEVISDAVSFTNSGASPAIAAISTQVNTCPSETVDLSSLTITDNNTVTGTATTFHSVMPTSAADMNNQLGTTTISADQTVFVMIANTATGCFDVASFMVDITACSTGVCDPNALVINDNPIAANTYQTAQTITSKGTVAASTTVAFKAAQTITLQAGFHAIAGSDFSAVIEACPATLVESETAKVIDQPSTQLATTSEIIGTPSVKVFPNPTTYRASIDLTLPVAESVQLDLFDLSGKRVANLVKEVTLPAGIHHFEWQCEQVDAGMYLLVLNGQVVSKLAVIR